MLTSCPGPVASVGWGGRGPGEGRGGGGDSELQEGRGMFSLLLAGPQELGASLSQPLSK